MSVTEKPRVWGDYKAHEHLSAQNIINALLCIFVITPSIAFTAVAYTSCDTAAADRWDTFVDATCTLTLSYPIAMVNILFFLNVSIGFWIIGLVQQNFWLIDPYWTILPPLIALFYQLNPMATTTTARSVLTMALIWLWSLRLTISYFRREEWKFGQREDWRYTKMAMENPTLWWLISFFAVGVAQQPMLIGISLPAYSVHRSDEPLNWVDAVAAVVCISGLTVAFLADGQLYEYMQRDRKTRPAVLNTGLWRYSRHPNYFGETTWWFGYGLLACSVGQWYMLCGWVLNTGVLLYVTVMTEQRMLGNRQGERLEAYVRYRAVTSCWIPWCNAAESTAQSTEARAPILTADEKAESNA